MRKEFVKSIKMKESVLLFLLFGISLARNDTSPKSEFLEIMNREKHPFADFWKYQSIVGIVGTMLNCIG